MKEITERRNGCFLHHDGGMEQSSAELLSLASRADVVLLPVRHVSHQAARQIKAVCQGRGIPFWPLRSSSVTAFSTALNAVARSTPRP
jgi:hypothetical protein